MDMSLGRSVAIWRPRPVPVHSFEQCPTPRGRRVPPALPAVERTACLAISAVVLRTLGGQLVAGDIDAELLAPADVPDWPSVAMRIEPPR